MIIVDAVTGKVKKTDVDDEEEGSTLTTLTYGTIDWANQEIEAGNKLLQEGRAHHEAVTRWIWGECQRRD